MRARSLTTRLATVAGTLAIAAGAAGGAALATAPEAAAATATSFCFVHSPSGAAYANKPVYLYQTNSKGQPVGGYLRAGSTAANGCGTFFNTPSTAYLRVYAGYTSGGHAWSGWTNYIAVPGAGGANLGTAAVVQQY